MRIGAPHSRSQCVARALARWARPILSGLLIDMRGWRAAYVALVVVWGGVVMTLAILFFRSKADTVRSSRDIGGEGAVAFADLLSARFLKMATAALLVTVGGTGLMMHMVPILNEGGLAREDALMVAGLMGIATVAGRLATGVLLDRFCGPLIASVAFLLPVVAATLLLNNDGSIMMAVAIACLVGLTLGAELDIMAYFSSRYFGTRRFGLMFGSVIALVSLGTGAGPFLAGLIYDVQGDYRVFFMALMPAAGLASILVGTMGPYPAIEAGPAGGRKVARPPSTDGRALSSGTPCQ